MKKVTDRVSRVLASFGRITSGGQFLPEIDGLRFVAIALVVAFHLNGYFQQRCPIELQYTRPERLLSVLLQRGSFGVPLFFLISGFILALPFAGSALDGGRSVSLRRYYTRRLTRLEPPYLVNLLLFTILLHLVKHVSWATLMPHLAASAVYVHGAVYVEHSLINSVAWSLELEVQFYLLVPLLTQMFRVKRSLFRRLALVAVALSAPTIVRIVPSLEHVARLSILGHLQYFLMGFLLADIYLVDWHKTPGRCWRWDVVSVISWPLLFLRETWNGAAPVVLPFLALLAYMAAFRGTVSNRIFRNRWIVTIGGMCYTIYLYHYAVISAVSRLTIRVPITSRYVINLGAQMLANVPVVLLVAAVMFRVFERPFMRRHWPARLAERLRTPLSTNTQPVPGSASTQVVADNDLHWPPLP